MDEGHYSYFKQGFGELSRKLVEKTYQKRTLQDRMQDFNDTRKQNRDTMILKRRNIDSTNLSPYTSPIADKTHGTSNNPSTSKSETAKQGTILNRFEKLKQWKAEREKKKLEEKKKAKPVFKVYHVPVTVGLPNYENVNKEIKGKPIKPTKSQFAPRNHTFKAPDNIKPLNFNFNKDKVRSDMKVKTKKNSPKKVPLVLNRRSVSSEGRELPGNHSKNKSPLNKFGSGSKPGIMLRNRTVKSSNKNGISISKLDFETETYTAKSGLWKKSNDNINNLRTATSNKKIDDKNISLKAKRHIDNSIPSTSSGVNDAGLKERNVTKGIKIRENSTDSIEIKRKKENFNSKKEEETHVYKLRRTGTKKIGFTTPNIQTTFDSGEKKAAKKTPHPMTKRSLATSIEGGFNLDSSNCALTGALTSKRTGEDAESSKDVLNRTFTLEDLNNLDEDLGMASKTSTPLNRSNITCILDNPDENTFNVTATSETLVEIKEKVSRPETAPKKSPRARILFDTSADHIENLPSKETVKTPQRRSRRSKFEKTINDKLETSSKKGENKETPDSSKTEIKKGDNSNKTQSKDADKPKTSRFAEIEKKAVQEILENPEPFKNSFLPDPELEADLRKTFEMKKGAVKKTPLRKSRRSQVETIEDVFENLDNTFTVPEENNLVKNSENVSSTKKRPKRTPKTKLNNDVDDVDSTLANLDDTKSLKKETSKTRKSPRTPRVKTADDSAKLDDTFGVSEKSNELRSEKKTPKVSGTKSRSSMFRTVEQSSDDLMTFIDTPRPVIDLNEVSSKNEKVTPVTSKAKSKHSKVEPVKESLNMSRPVDDSTPTERRISKIPRKTPKTPKTPKANSRQSTLRSFTKQKPEDVENETSIVPEHTSSNSIIKDKPSKSRTKKEQLSQAEPSDQKTPESFRSPITYISPFVTISRGRDSARKEFKLRHSSGGKLDINKELSAATSPTAGAAYFTYQVDCQVHRIENMCDEWSTYKDGDDIPEEAKEMIDAALGQSKLLLTKKIVQFRKLIEQCKNEQDAERPVTCTDLHGYWDTMYIQINDIDKRFNNLSTLRDNDWKEVLPDKTVVKSRVNNGKAKKVQASSKIRDMIKAAKAKKMNEDVKRRSLVVQKSLSSRASSSPGLTMMKVSQNIKSGNGITPSKSILKTKGSISEKRVNKSVLFDLTNTRSKLDFSDDEEENKKNFTQNEDKPKTESTPVRRSLRLNSLSKSSTGMT